MGDLGKTNESDFSAVDLSGELWKHSLPLVFVATELVVLRDNFSWLLHQNFFFWEIELLVDHVQLYFILFPKLHWGSAVDPATGYMQLRGVSTLTCGSIG